MAYKTYKIRNLKPIVLNVLQQNFEALINWDLESFCHIIKDTDPLYIYKKEIGIFKYLKTLVRIDLFGTNKFELKIVSITK